MDAAGRALILEGAGHDLDADRAVKVLESSGESSKSRVPWWWANDPHHHSEAHHPWCQSCYICPLFASMLCFYYSPILRCCVVPCCLEEGRDDPFDHEIRSEIPDHYPD